MDGFFSTSDLIVKAPLSLTPQCGLCGLHQSCHSPKMPVAGKGKRKILILGEAPGKTEDARNLPFVGESGQLLRRALNKIGISADDDCWVTNSARCRPPNNKLPDRSVEYCRPNVIEAVKELQPKVIILLGASAVKSLIGWLWKEDVGPLGKWVGWRIPSQKLNAWICPTWHPAAILRSENSKGNEVMELLWENHLKRACALLQRPWGNNQEDLPDYEQLISIILDPEEADKYLDHFLVDTVTTNRPVAFDYETNMLKPDSKSAEIVSCSLSAGEDAFAFPWHGKVIRRMKEFLRSDVPKIASNAKFEERWTRKIFGHGVRNWVFDTMLAAHALDNRPGITSIKFQAFIHLGVDAWDEHIKPLFQSKGSNEPNRIQDISLDKLLAYNAMDSLMEWHVAQIQAKQLGVEL